jgi:hypothetical protein
MGQSPYEPKGYFLKILRFRVFLLSFCANTVFCATKPVLRGSCLP